MLIETLETVGSQRVVKSWLAQPFKGFEHLQAWHTIVQSDVLIETLRSIALRACGKVRKLAQPLKGLCISSPFTHHLPEWPAHWTLQTDGTGDFAHMNLAALAFGQCIWTT